MHHFDQWAKNKPPAIKSLAYIFCGNLTFWHRLLDGVRRLPASTFCPGEFNLEKWLDLYDNEFKLFDTFTSAITELSNTLNLPFDIDELGEKEDLYDEKYINLLELHRIALNSESSSDTDMLEIELDYDFLFLFKVIIPCALLHVMLPEELLKKAGNGDLQALESILHIDKLTIYDPRIRNHIVNHAADADLFFLERIGKALASSYKPFPLKRMKVMAGSLIYYFSQKNDIKLSTKKLLDMFDAIAKDKLGLERDPDLDMAPASFEKAVERYAYLWE